jgi:hypothetical protein
MGLTMAHYNDRLLTLHAHNRLTCISRNINDRDKNIQKHQDTTHELKFIYIYIIYKYNTTVHDSIVFNIGAE